MKKEMSVFEKGEALMQKTKVISIPARNGLCDITRQVEAMVSESGVQAGMVNVSVQGATARVMALVF